MTRLAFSSRRLRVAAILAVGLLAVPAAAFASWSASSSGGVGQARAQAMGNPTGVTAVANDSSSITVSWSAPGASFVPPSAYRVTRTSPTPATVVCASTTNLSCTDTGLSSSTAYTYSVVSLRGNNWASSGASASATTPAANAFLVELVAAGNKTAGSFFQVRVTAQTAGTTDTSYTGTHTLAWSGPANARTGTTPVYPTNPVNFASGVATVNVTLYRAETVNLAVAEGARSGSTSVTVVAAALNRLWFTSSSTNCDASPINVTKNTTWTSKVSVADTYGNQTANNATARTVTVSHTGQHAGVSFSGDATIAAGASPSETSGQVQYVLDNGVNKTGTVTASDSSLTPLTSATCTIKTTN